MRYGIEPDRYDRFLGPITRPFAQELVDGDERPATRVLDHGARTGDTAMIVHRRHPKAQVVAVEPDGPWLARLFAKAGPEAAWLTIHEQPLDSPLPGGPYDRVLSHMGLMLATDPVDRLRTLLSATRPGGSLGASVPGPPARFVVVGGFWTAVSRVVDRAAAPDTYREFSLSDPDRLAAAARSAGWSNPQVRMAAHERDYTAEAIWEGLWSVLPIALASGEQTTASRFEQYRDAIRLALLAELAPHRAGPLYRLPAQAWLLTADKA